MPRLDTPEKRKNYEQDLRLKAQGEAITETEETIETWWWHFTDTLTPNNGDQYYLLGVRRATTIVAAYTVLTFSFGFPPSMDFQLSHDPTFKAGAPANVYLAAQTSTTATMEQFLPDDDATIPAGSVLWATMSNKIQTPDAWGLTLQLQWT